MVVLGRVPQAGTLPYEFDVSEFMSVLDRERLLPEKTRITQ